MFYDYGDRKIFLKQKLLNTKETYRKYGLRSALRMHWWSVNRGSSDVMFGIGVYSAASKTKWFKYTIKPLHKLFVRIDNVKYWVRYRIHPNHRYHIVKTNLRPGYYDADERMFQACFAVLGQFVERGLGKKSWNRENPEEDLYRGYRLHSADIEDNDISGFPARRSPDRDAIDLWLWYKEELPALEEDYNKDLHEVYSGALRSEAVENSDLRRLIIKKNRKPKYEHDYPETVKEQKLNELIKIRRCLWT